MMPKAVFFDFDGVLVDSVDIKTEAMRLLFAGEQPAHVAEIVALHERLGGVSRYRKFEIAYETILRRPLSEGEMEALGARFSELALDAIAAAPMIPGAREFLERYCRRALLFVVSGTPDRELRAVLERRDLGAFFQAAHGSPALKPDILRDLLARHGLAPEDACFVGDAGTDFEAAECCGVPFVGVVAPGRASPFERTVRIVPDLTSLDLVLEAGYDTVGNSQLLEMRT
jgi:phosphoglycolate phosphatase-like HAD superfamily hydrolase